MLFRLERLGVSPSCRALLKLSQPLAICLRTSWPNAELTARFDALGKPTGIEKLRARTGTSPAFLARKVRRPQISLCLAAIEATPKRARRKLEDVDLTIVGTVSSDYIAPSHLRTFWNRN